MNILKEILRIAPEDSNAVQNIYSISKTIEQNHSDKKNCSQSEEKTGRKCFLSVIIRTQGKRERLLKEAIESLKAQTCDDFEIILIGHKLTEDGKDSLRSFVNSIDCIIDKDKVSLYFLDKGNRTAPLNYGFSLSSGKYISVLDDDDTVLPNWVELFKNNDCGKVLHSYCYEQDWKTEKNKSAAAGPLKTHYLADFNMLKQIKENFCPLHSLAFPSYLFNDLDFVFDESLTTNEDWDYLMRTAIFSGVLNIRQPSCIYKKWIDIENSVSSHSKAEWNSNQDVIRNKIASSVLMLSADDSRNFVNDAVKRKSEIEEKDCYKHFLKTYRNYLKLKVLNTITFGLVPGIKKEFAECRKLYRSFIDY